MRLNLGKTVVMDIDGGSGQLDPPTLTYKWRTVKTQVEESCRHLGFWATPNGDMAKTKQRVLAKTRGGTGASDTPSVRIQSCQGTISQHGGECVQIFCSSSALEQSRT
jgi:hypothetical protein